MGAEMTGADRLKEKRTGTGGACAYAIVDRCGNNWTNGKGGCGLLVQTECCNTVATAFNPLVFSCPTRSLQGGQMREKCEWRR